MEKYYNLGSGEKNLLCSIDESNKYDYDLDTYDFDFKRENDSHICIVNEVSNNSLVLDVGCATGLIGQGLTKYKNCIVDGIEYDKVAYTKAKEKNVYRNIYNLSIISEKQKIIRTINEKYDYIIFADVLEHLVEPWKALINIFDLLKDDGKVIISLPNIANIDIIRALINGEFNYQHLGLLDSTHLRFFSSKSFVDMVRNMATRYNIVFNIEFIKSMYFTPPYHENDEGLFNLFNLDGVTTQDFLILQHIIILTKSKNGKVLVKGLKTRNDYFNKIDFHLQKIYQENQSKSLMIEEKTRECENLALERKKLKNEYSLLEKNYNILEDKYLKVINSKGWKLMEKLRKLKNSILKK